MNKGYLFRAIITGVLSFGMLFITSQSQAQTKWYLGGRAGPSLTNMVGDFPGNNYKLGYSGGATVGLAMGDDYNFSIQADLMASLKGFNQKYEEVATIEDDRVVSKTTTEFDNDLNLGYLELPITAKYSLTLGGGVFPYESRKGSFHIDFFAGPYVGYLFGAGASFNTTQTNVVTFLDESGEKTNENKDEADIDGGKFRVKGRDAYGLNPYGNIDTFSNVNIPSKLTDGLSSIDIGVTAGLGISLDVGENGRLGLEGRFSRGMVSIDDGFFNSIEITGFDDNFKPQFEYEQADIKNVNMAAYLSYVYYIPNTTF